MAEKIPNPPPQMADLHLAIESEDWVTIRGTTADLKRLGELLIEFARAEGNDHAILDSPPFFREGSLGIYLDRTA